MQPISLCRRATHAVAFDSTLSAPARHLAGASLFKTKSPAFKVNQFLSKTVGLWNAIDLGRAAQ
jgi:hypothetical protein